MRRVRKYEIRKKYLNRLRQADTTLHLSLIIRTEDTNSKTDTATN
ncbi:MAG: hypothetical protein WCQ90_04435 [Deltaproteobacteria bacterium]